MNALEKSVIMLAAPIIAAQVPPALKPILDNALKSASPELQAVEGQLEAFLLGVIPALMTALAADAAAH